MIYAPFYISNKINVVRCSRDVELLAGDKKMALLDA